MMTNMRKKITNWAMTPIVIPRSAFVLKYLAFAYFGFVSAIAGVPVFTLTTPQGYAFPWGIFLFIAGAAGVYGASRQDHETVERWAVLAITSLMLPYLVSLNVVGFISHDPSRQAVAAGMQVIFIIPAFRFIWLLRQAGKGEKKADKIA